VLGRLLVAGRDALEGGVRAAASAGHCGGLPCGLRAREEVSDAEYRTRFADAPEPGRTCSSVVSCGRLLTYKLLWFGTAAEPSEEWAAVREAQHGRRRRRRGAVTRPAGAGRRGPSGQTHTAARAWEIGQFGARWPWHDGGGKAKRPSSPRPRDPEAPQRTQYGKILRLARVKRPVCWLAGVRKARRPLHCLPPASDIRPTSCASCCILCSKA
jgi:hypothetical protein